MHAEFLCVKTTTYAVFGSVKFLDNHVGRFYTRTCFWKSFSSITDIKPSASLQGKLSLLIFQEVISMAFFIKTWHYYCLII